MLSVSAEEMAKKLLGLPHEKGCIGPWGVGVAWFFWAGWCTMCWMACLAYGLQFSQRDDDVQSEEDSSFSIGGATYGRVEATV